MSNDWVVLLKNKDKANGLLVGPDEEAVHFPTKEDAMEVAHANPLCRAYGALVVNVETGETDWTF